MTRWGARVGRKRKEKDAVDIRKKGETTINRNSLTDCPEKTIMMRHSTDP
jgi:hypothetical protein